MQQQISTTAEAAESSAIPRCHEVHTSPEAVAPSELLQSMMDEPVDQKSAAEWAYQRLIIYIQNFEKTLDNEHEVAMGFTGADAGIMRIEGMGYFDPDIVTFYGSDAQGTETQLVQHYSQLNVILRALPKVEQAAPPNRIGFRLAQDLKHP